MKNVSKTLGIVASMALLVSAVLLLCFIFGWISSDDLQSGIGKTVAVCGVILVTGLGLLGITKLIAKD